MNGAKMKKPRYKKKPIRFKQPVCDGLDSYKWATRMEIRHLFAGKTELRIKAGLKASD